MSDCSSSDRSVGPIDKEDTDTAAPVKFWSTVELGGKTATGIAVPEEVVTALGAGRRPAVRVTLGGHSYRTTVASMGGRFLVPLNADNRAAAGVQAGDTVEVEIVKDSTSREVNVPADLAGAMDATARTFFDSLSYTHRKEWVRWIEDAKKADTRSARVTKTIAALQARRRSR